MIRIQPRYTEVLLNLLENSQTKPLVDKALSTYPMYVSTINHEYIPNIIPTREELNQKLLNHYKYREIGFETVGRFLDELEITMNEIMPYYNQLFFTQDQDFNIIYNVDYVKTIDRDRDISRNEQATNNITTTNEAETTNTGRTTTNNTVTNTDTTSGTSNEYGKNVKSDTPQNSLGIGNTDIDDVDYASEVDWNHNTNTSSGTSNGSSTANGSGTNNETSNTEGTTETLGTTRASDTTEEDEAIRETTKGNFGVVSAQDLIEKYRKIIINVEQMIINDPRITELFMNVY